MASKLDEYLKNASPEQKAALDNAKNIFAKEGIKAEETAKTELHATPNPKQNLQYGGANEYKRPQAELNNTPTQKKDTLSKYSVSTKNDQKIENSLGNDRVQGGMNNDMER
jgi:hypothetical protein